MNLRLTSFALIILPFLAGPAIADHHAKAEAKGPRGGGPALLDANKDGQISKEEFLAAHAKRFATGDRDGDGRITQEERDAARQAMREQMQERREQRRAQMAERGQRQRQDRMAAVDSDGDGAISRAEHDAAVAEQFAKIDANGDGNVTREEMQAARPNRGEGMRGQRQKRDKDNKPE